MEGFVLTFPEALAIVGSVATVVLGVFGYLLKIRSKDAPPADKTVTPAPTKYLEGQVQVAHERISEIKDRVTSVEGEVKLTASKIEAIRTSIKEHQIRDNQDHEVFDKKLDKMMDILIKILTDDKL